VEDKDMVTITASVGQGGVNRSADVQAIQNALNSISAIGGGASPPLKVDGMVGPKTIAAILKFQKTNLGLTQDGKVDPSGSTLQRINFILDGSTKDPKTLAMASLPVASFWTSLALASIQGNTALPTTQAALNTHFHLNNGKLNQAIYLNIIRTNYTKVQAVFARAARVFRSRSDAEAAQDKAIDKSGHPFPAYTWFNESINFSSEFHDWNGVDGFGPMCQAAMVLHEPVHFVDVLANEANDFYEHGLQYNGLTADQAVHNPSSYVCYAEQIAFGSDVRFGAGKRAL
jgi:peptidoglycan hydrolase-like protein with peptidoglycan-binding domain